MQAVVRHGTFHVRAGESGLAGENMWGMQSRQIVSRYAPHVCASPLGKHSNVSSRSSPGALSLTAQEIGTEQVSVPMPSLLKGGVERQNVAGDGKSCELNPSQNPTRRSSVCGLQTGHSAPLIRFGMDTKERARERAVGSPASGAPSQHSPTCFSQELACLSPISSPGAFRFGAAASSAAGLGLVLPGGSAESTAKPLEGVAEPEPARSPAQDSSDSYSEDYSDPEV